MRRVYRKDSPCPTAWHDGCLKALPNYREFLRYAEEFEKLGVNSTKRRTGFLAFAPDVLVVKNGKARFPSIWGKHKEVIAGMSCRKCVYCEGPINAPRTAHVEHFKPKALFPSLAYEWTNYFLGCAGCNGAKGDKWPERGGYIRPDSGDPGSHFAFSEDGSMQPVSPGGSAERMLTDFDLNRKWLVYRRKLEIEKMRSLLAVAVGFLKKGHGELARSLAGVLLGTIDVPGAAYSVALTQCFWRAWKGASGGKV